MGGGAGLGTAWPYAPSSSLDILLLLPPLLAGFLLAVLTSLSRVLPIPWHTSGVFTCHDPWEVWRTLPGFVHHLPPPGFLLPFPLLLAILFYLVRALFTLVFPSFPFLPISRDFAYHDSRGGWGATSSLPSHHR